MENQDTAGTRQSRRLLGLEPEFDSSDLPERKRNQSPVMAEETTLNNGTIHIPAYRQYKNPSYFSGEATQDPEKWLKEYQRVAKYNQWDDTVCLANAYFFLNGTARMWFENNEDTLTSWTLFQEGLKAAFGDSLQMRSRAEEQLKKRAQSSGEMTQSYIQDVLGLCQKVNPSMSEEEKVAHLMKGVAEDVYQALLTKTVTSTKDFVKWCQHIESLQQKRIKLKEFKRLPNVTSVATCQEQQDLATLIRQIVREEVQKFLTPVVSEPDYQSLESLVKSEVGRSLAPLSRTLPPQNGSDTGSLPQTYASIASHQNSRNFQQYQPSRGFPEAIPRKTEIWRTENNRPVCFHCGKPGHVVRYCRERRQIFNNFRNGHQDRNVSFQPTFWNEGRQNQNVDFRNGSSSRSPSPNARGRSPLRRNRSPSPFRNRQYNQSANSPQNGEN